MNFWSIWCDEDNERTQTNWFLMVAIKGFYFKVFKTMLKGFYMFFFRYEFFFLWLSNMMNMCRNSWTVYGSVCIITKWNLHLNYYIYVGDVRLLHFKQNKNKTKQNNAKTKKEHAFKLGFNGWRQGRQGT